MLRISVQVVLLALSGNLAAAAESTPDGSRAELLYNTHCIACHTAKVHWREEKLAIDWNSLKAQVDRWQTNSGLRWNAQDISDVAFYLNILHYNYPVTD